MDFLQQNPDKGTIHPITRLGVNEGKSYIH